MDSVDAIVVGGGLAGLVAAAELGDRGKSVLLLDQEGEQNLGGQAFWSLGGLFMVDTPEQRRMRVRDSYALARSDWMGAAQFDRPEDAWPRKWADSYLTFAAGEMRSWLHNIGMRWFPVVGWAERGGAFADAHGNSVPRFHITWGTGPGVVEPFARRVRELGGDVRRAGGEIVPRGRRRFRVCERQRDRDLGRNRRKPRSRARRMASGPARHTAGGHGGRGPDPRGRRDDRHH